MYYKKPSALLSIDQRLQRSGGRLQCKYENVGRNNEGRMPQSYQDYAAELHICAAHAHTAAAAAHHRHRRDPFETVAAAFAAGIAAGAAISRMMRRRPPCNRADAREKDQ